jgi:hypothetical protein
MLPMSLGLGEGGEQNAPLGRAVIGGLLVATVFTLFFVPVMYSLLRRQAPVTTPDEDEEQEPTTNENSTVPMLLASHNGHSEHHPNLQHGGN